MFFKKKALKLASAFLGVAMLGTVFAGCGGGDTADKGGAAADEIVVGANVEITGNQANYGSAGLKGFKLAIKEINEAGGVNGKQIKIVEADTKSDAAEAVNSATKLISDDGVKLIFGPAVTANVIAESAVATENKVPVVGFAATNPDVTVENGQVKPFVFRSCFIDPQQGTVMAQFAAKDLNAKTAVLYIDNSSDYSKSLGKVFKETFEAAGGQVVMEEAFLAKDQDFKAALTKIKTANADVIFVPCYYEEAGKIVKQARELGITCPLLGTDGWDDPKVADIAGAEALNDTFFSTHYFDQDPGAQAFIEAFKKEYNDAPNVFAALGYDAGKLIADALKRAASLEGEAICKALEETKDLQVATAKITMDPSNHNPIKDAVIIENKDGKYTLKAKIAPEK